MQTEEQPEDLKEFKELRKDDRRVVETSLLASFLFKDDRDTLTLSVIRATALPIELSKLIISYAICSGYVRTLVAAQKNDVSQFLSPAGIAVIPEATEHIFVADTKSNLIRRVHKQTGVVMTFAGTGTAAFADGYSTFASFNQPQGICIGPWPDYDIYLADTLNHRIRKISQSGIVTTVAGSGSYFVCSDGERTKATFDHPTGVVADSQGNLFVADCNNNRIRRITLATGEVSTFCGTGQSGFIDKKGSGAAFSSPHGICVDSHDNIYVADTYNHCIRKISPTGVCTTLAGGSKEGYSDGLGTQALFSHPHSVCVDEGDYVYVADTLNNRIRRISPDGVVSTVGGSGKPDLASGFGEEAAFYEPAGICVDSSTGVVYVADTKNNSIRVIT